MIELTDESFKQAKKFLEQYQADVPLQTNQRYTLHNLLEIFKILQARAEQLETIKEDYSVIVTPGN